MKSTIYRLVLLCNSLEDNEIPIVLEGPEDTSYSIISILLAQVTEHPTANDTIVLVGGPGEVLDL